MNTGPLFASLAGTIDAEIVDATVYIYIYIYIYVLKQMEHTNGNLDHPTCNGAPALV